MKNGFKFLTILMLAMPSCTNAQKSLFAQEYVSVTMDLQGILELKMTTDPHVDFIFNTIQKYQSGIIKYNATKLNVTATVPWDLYVQPSSEYWNQQSLYSASGNATSILPSEVLEIQSAVSNPTPEALTLNNFIGLTSQHGTNISGLTPTASTQFLAGGYNSDRTSYRQVGSSAAALTSNGNQFIIHYRIKPGVPVNFPNLSGQYPALAAQLQSSHPSIQPGYYSIEIVYTLVEDL